jgi:histidinol-phosphate aminotransferase
VAARRKALINKARSLYSRFTFSEYKFVSKTLLRKIIKEEKIVPFMIASTSGSSGEPFTFPKSKYAFLNSQSTYYYFFKQFGISRFDRNVYIGGARSRNPSGMKVLKARLYSFMFNQSRFASSDLRDELDFKNVVDLIKTSQPIYISGFGSALVKLANYILKQKIELGYVPILLHPTAEAITQEEVEIIRKAFRPSYVAMVYGSTEGHFASQCPEGIYHINEHTCQIENDGDSLVVTIFDSNDMPFVDYIIGDTGKVIEINCRCGRKGKILESLIGRSSEFIDIGGVKITQADINMLIQGELRSASVTSYQIVLLDDGAEVRVEGDNASAKLIAGILNSRYGASISYSDAPIILDDSGKKKAIKNISSRFRVSHMLNGYQPYLEISQASEADPSSLVLKLDWNEGFAKPTPIMDFKLTSDILNYYPDLKSSQLRAAAADFYGVSSDLIESFNGSDAALNCICQSYLDNNKSFSVISPSYGNYVAIAKKYTNKMSEITIDPYSKDFFSQLSTMISSCGGDVVFLANPNNPTGKYLDNESLLKLINGNKAKLFIIDQAYQEFVSGSHTIEAELIRADNVIVTRTLSKAFSLAGIRIGFAIANKTLMQGLRLTRDNKQVNSLSQHLAAFALRHPEYMFEYIKTIEKSKNRISLVLTKQNITPIMGEGNFFLLRCNNSAEFYQKLRKQNIFVRDRGSLPFLENHVRITVPALEHVDHLIKGVINAYEL